MARKTQKLSSTLTTTKPYMNNEEPKLRSQEQIKYWVVLVLYFKATLEHFGHDKLKDNTEYSDLLKLCSGLYTAKCMYGLNIITPRSLSDAKSMRAATGFIQQAVDFLKNDVGISIPTPEEFHEAVRQLGKEKAVETFNRMYRIRLSTVKPFDIRKQLAYITEGINN